MAVRLYEPGGEWASARDRVLANRWPEADEDRLAELSGIWQQVGAELDLLEHDGGAAINEVLSAFGGEAGETISGRWATLSGYPNGISALVEHVGEVESATRTAATAVAEAKSLINAEIGEALASLASLRDADAAFAEPIVDAGHQAVGTIVDNLTATLSRLPVAAFEPLPDWEQASDHERIGDVVGAMAHAESPRHSGLEQAIRAASLGGAAGTAPTFEAATDRREREWPGEREVASAIRETWEGTWWDPPPGDI